MKKLLHIVASPREEHSTCLQVSRVFLDKFKEKHPEYQIDELNLFVEELPDLTHRRVDGKYVLLGGKELYGDLKEAWEEIIRHINRFLSADFYLISTPMWNYSVPYKLKQYIDVIVQPKYLFRYTDHGVEGLAKNKKMVVVGSRGGEYSSPSTQELDFQKEYLKTIFEMVGINDFTYLKVEPMDMGQELRKEKIKLAQSEAIKLAERE